MKLTTIWINFDVISKYLQSKNSTGEYNEFINIGNNFNLDFWERLLNLIITSFKTDEIFRDLFDGYEQEYKENLVNLLDDNKNRHLIFGTIWNELTGQLFNNKIWGELSTLPETLEQLIARKKISMEDFDIIVGWANINKEELSDLSYVEDRIDTYLEESPEEQSNENPRAEGIAKIEAKYGERLVFSESANWNNIDVWAVEDKGDNFNGFFIIDDMGTFTFIYRVFNETTREYDSEDIKDVPYSNIDELLEFVENYDMNIKTQELYEQGVIDIEAKYGEALEIGADWSVNTWLVKYLGNIGYYICDDDENNEFQFISRNWDNLTGDDDIKELAKFSYHAMENLFYYIETYDYSEVEDLATRIFEPNEIFTLKPEFKDGNEGEYYVIEDRGNKVLASPNWETGLSIIPQDVIGKNMIAEILPYKFVAPIIKFKPVKIKYVAIKKTTYDTDKSGLEFSVEINGVTAKGFWSPTGQYCVDGVDVNELIINSGSGTYGTRFNIFAGGGGRRHYEIFGYPKVNEKQPKNLSFTGKYYSTLELGILFKNKIQEALAGNNKNTNFTKEFLTIFKIK